MMSGPRSWTTDRWSRPPDQADLYTTTRPRGGGIPKDTPAAYTSEYECWT